MYLVAKSAGKPIARYSIGICQVLMSSLLIHLTGGRIETHFHIFGSLAFLAFYRDWKVLVPATAFVAVDHIARGIFWPMSVYGVVTSSPWRSVEHAGWVIFEDIFLFISIRQSVQEMRRIAQSRAKLESTNLLVEECVKDRTEKLQQVNEVLASEALERELAEIEANNREKQMQTILENANEGIMTVNQWGIVESFNVAAAKMFGYPAEEVISQNISKLFVPPENQESLDLESALFTCNGMLVNGTNELQGIKKDSTHFPVLISVNDVKIKGKQIFTAILRDLTKQKQMQCELAQAQKLESVGQLAAGIAHEINTPTQYVGDNARFLKDAFGDLNTALDGFGKLLDAAKSGELNEQVLSEVEASLEEADIQYLAEEIPQAIDQSLDGVERVAKIVRAMKEFSHPGSDEKKLVNLKESIETTITVARNEWKYVAKMETEFDDTLPEVSCLPGELNQVILNLIVNAAHAIGDVLGENSTEQGTISIGTRRDGKWAEIYVRDTGTGIPESVRARIFDPFFTTKGVGKGTGQGLAIAHSVIVDKHNGTIDCKSQKGKGTTFIVRIPISEDSQVEKTADLNSPVEVN